MARRQEARRIVLLQNYFPLAATSEKGGGEGGGWTGYPLGDVRLDVL